MSPFAPCFIFENELTVYGLPTADDQPDIMNLVQLASTIVDTECGRIDDDGNGSLVYTTYVQRILLQARNRNLIQLPMKPIIGLTSNVISDLSASGAAVTGALQPYYTGAQVSTFNQPNGALSGIVSCSGRYGYIRQDRSVGYPDLQAMINPLNLVTMFGGPAPWVGMDVTNIDYDPKIGEAWLPAGIQLQAYSEIWIVYTSGYDPRRMPPTVKFVTAALVKNALAKGDGTTGLMSMQLGKSGLNYSFYKELLDPTLDSMLTPFKVVRAY